VGAGEGDPDSALPSLAYAQPEAEAVAEELPGAIVLTGADASRLRIEQTIRSGASLLHFAGHAVANPLDAASSFLLLARGERWTPERNSTLDLSHLSLVVLSGCSTLDPLASEDSAAFGLAGTFYAAGARAVLGTGSPVRDRDAAEMARLFYRAGIAVDPVAGYRSGVLLARASKEGLDSPAIWGVWRLFGGLNAAENRSEVRRMSPGAARN
jgi:CHAT domain-containing protein